MLFISQTYSVMPGLEVAPSSALGPCSAENQIKLLPCKGRSQPIVLSLQHHILFLPYYNLNRIKIFFFFFNKDGSNPSVRQIILLLFALLFF